MVSIDNGKVKGTSPLCLVSGNSKIASFPIVAVLWGAANDRDHMPTIVFQTYVYE